MSTRPAGAIRRASGASASPARAAISVNCTGHVSCPRNGIVTVAAENATPESLRSGVELTLRQLEGVFEKQSLQEINPVGQKFDPHRHQAISTLPSDKEPNTVINVLQKGYALHDRVIRPALVTVAKPKDA